jgi:hypothetical protein
MGMKLEVRGGRHAKARRGGKASYFNPWPRPGNREYICDKYTI